ncbi:hypothetical protein GA0115240_11454, partial [Streptomyces sp. DvalAA-14]|uniref:hypothetical protein n=1 Tax=unclassified Streptomyces TaxID=2593676 RepID=UPI00081B74DD
MASASAGAARPQDTGQDSGLGRGGFRGRTGDALRLAGPALLGYGAARLLGIALLYYLAKRRGVSPGTVLYGSWDSRWYQMIAAHGYDHSVTGVPHSWHPASDLAFFPLYPALCRAAHAVLPLGLPKSSWLVGMAAAFAAAWLIFLIGNRLEGRRTGTVLAVLWGCLPHALVENMAYTEALFTALCAAALHTALSRHWVRSGLFAALAGLTRPTGVAIAAAISLTALVAAVQGLRGRAEGERWWRPVWRPVLGAALAPAGWFSFVVWVGVRLHRSDGYFAVQDAWGNKFSKGGYLLRRIRWVFLGRRGVDVPVAYVVVTVVVVVSFALYAVCLAQRQPLPLLLFSGALLAVLGFATASSSPAPASCCRASRCSFR